MKPGIWERQKETLFHTVYSYMLNFFAPRSGDGHQLGWDWKIHWDFFYHWVLDRMAMWFLPIQWHSALEYQLKGSNSQKGVGSGIFFLLASHKKQERETGCCTGWARCSKHGHWSIFISPGMKEWRAELTHSRKKVLVSEVCTVLTSRFSW